MTRNAGTYALLMAFLSTPAAGCAVLERSDRIGASGELTLALASVPWLPHITVRGEIAIERSVPNAVSGTGDPSVRSFL